MQSLLGAIFVGLGFIRKEDLTRYEVNEAGAQTDCKEHDRYAIVALRANL